MKFTNAAGTQEFYNSLERTKSTGIPQGSGGASLHEAKRYLNQFGYLKYEDSNNLENDEALELAITTYQTFYQLEVTGKLDSNTFKQMTIPHCGLPNFY